MKQVLNRTKRRSRFVKKRSLNPALSFNIKTAGFVLIIFLAVLLFVSNTIYNWNLPVVTAAVPFNGKLTKTEKSKGIADFENMAEVYTDLGGKVEKVHVKDGQLVEKGQPLLEMSFDREELTQSLKELDISLQKAEGDISAGNIKRQQNTGNMDFLQNEQPGTEALSDYDMKQKEREAAIAEEDFKNMETLYQSGAVAKADYENARNALEVLRNERDESVKTYNEAAAKKKEDEENKEETKQQEIRGYQTENELLLKEIEQNRLDIQAFNLQKAAVEKKLADFGENEILYASESGKLMDFEIEKGQKLPDHGYVSKIGLTGSFEIECPLSVDNNFTLVGDKCKLKNVNHSFDAYVSDIKLSQGAKLVTVRLESDEVSAGETFDVTFEKESSESYVLVPSGTLNMDSSGYFLYQIKRRDGIIGKEFYTQKIRVYIGDNDDTNTAITKGLSFFEPISLYSDKPFSEGQTIYLNNEGDFFED